MIIKFLKLVPYIPKGYFIWWKCIAPLLPNQIRNCLGDVGGVKMYLDLGDELGFQYARGVYNKDELEFLLNAYDPGTYFLDIGANQGFYSLLFAKRRPDAKIVAFEPEPCSVNKLLKNITINGFQNIKVCPYGLSDTNDPKLLMISTHRNQGGHSMVISQTPWQKKKSR